MIMTSGSRSAIRKGGSHLAIRKSTEMTLTWEQSPDGAVRPQAGVKPLLVSFMGNGNPDGVADYKQPPTEDSANKTYPIREGRRASGDPLAVFQQPCFSRH